MSIKPTVISAGQGLPSPAAESVPQGAPEGHKPTTVAPATVSFAPTQIPGSVLPLESDAIEAPKPKARDFGISAIPGVKRAAAELSTRVVTGLETTGALLREGSTQVLKAFTPSALPGLRRVGLEVSEQELQAKFPYASESELSAAKSLLAGVMPATSTASTWLGFGLKAQEELAALVKERLEVVQGATPRVLAQHLARLQSLLVDVLEAFEGGLFRKSPDAVWSANRDEVLSLEQLLQTGITELAKQIKTYEQQQAKVNPLSLRINATAIAAVYLASTQADAGGVLVARMTSLANSQALLVEHATHLANDIQTVQELATLVQTGVLVKLPAVYTQLAALSGKPTETQRFLAAEKLNDVLHVIKQRTLT